MPENSADDDRSWWRPQSAGIHRVRPGVLLARIDEAGLVGADLVRTEVERAHGEGDQPPERGPGGAQPGWAWVDWLEREQFETLVFVRGDVHSFDAERDLPRADPVRIEFLRTGALQVTCLLTPPTGEVDEQTIRKTSAVWLAGRGARLARYGHGEDPGAAAVLEISLDGDLPTLGELYRLGIDTIAMVHGLARPPLDGESIRAAILAGCPSLVLGSRENLTLDVKAYDYKTPNTAKSDQAWKVDFALDVARFANAAGGLLLLGFDEKPDPPRRTKVIGKLSPLRQSVAPEDRRQWLEAHLYPAVEGLEITEHVYHDERGPAFIVMIHVPCQPEALKPFIVYGETAQDDWQRHHLIIPVRRDEGSVNWNAQTIHRLLARGRQAEWEDGYDSDAII